MFYGMQGFATKWVYGLSLWVLTFLLARFGNSPDQPLSMPTVSSGSPAW